MTSVTRRPALRTIPKGLRPPAQGWRVTPTLGVRAGNGNNANGVVANVTRPDGNELAATALRLGMFLGRRPRVARPSQPWALGRNPVGILERSATLRVAAGSPVRRWLDVSAASLCADVLRVADVFDPQRFLQNGRIAIERRRAAAHRAAARRGMLRMANP